MEAVLQQRTQENEQKGKHLTFLLGSETFGLEICYITEIVGMQKISDLPNAPSYVKGIMNLRGKIIPVVDMRLRLHKEPAPYSDRTCIVVVDIRSTAIGLVVDRVNEVEDIPESSIVPPPAFGSGQRHNFIKGIGKEGEDVRLLLDCERLFAEEETDALGKLEE